MQKQFSFLRVLLVAASAQLSAGNSFFVTAPVQAQVDAQGLGADACQYAGVTLVRHNYPNEAAIQLGGNFPGDPTRIYTKAVQGSFFLTDAGSQWASGVATNQKVLAVVETQAGQHAWNGADYAGAGLVTITKPDLVNGLLALPSILMTRLPIARLLQGSPTSIAVEVPASPDPSGLGVGLRLWKHKAAVALDPWVLVADLAWQSAGALTVTDTAVTAGDAYVYGVSYIYDWPGGQGAGATVLPGKYVSQAKGFSNPYFASLLQPTPTPFPTLVPPIATPSVGSDAWVAYPNPLVGSELHLAFKTEKDQSKYWATFYSIDGTKVLGVSGLAPVQGWQKPVLDLSKLASGVYLVRLRVLQPGLDEQTLPVRKLAVVK